MATYKGINGFAVQSVASDPSPLDEGQVWYNNATYAFKLAAATTVGTWASGGNLNTARNNVASANSGTQTAALAFGGSSGSASESYNGTSWTTTPSLNTSRTQLGGSGTQTAALAFGGSPVTGATELWNGSSWTTSPATLNTTRRDLSGAGLQTATIAFGGITGAPAYSANSESFNGTSWTATPALNSARQAIGSAGTQTSALAIGGNGAFPSPDTTTDAMEAWNGSSWTTSTSIPAARQDGQSFGLQTAAVFAGGQNAIGSNFANTFLWNGTSWTTNPNSLTTARGTGGGAGTQSLGIIFGGVSDPGPSAATEEWTGPGSPVTKTITTS
jgi:hypothetical protein